LLKEQLQSTNGGFLLLARTTIYRIRRSGSHDDRGAEIRDALLHFAHQAKRIALRNRRFLVVSRPKSGRTWLRFMLDRLGVYLPYSHPDDRVPLPGEWKGRAILFLHRDPRDTLISSWFAQRKRHGGGSEALGDFLRDPEHGLERIVLYNLFWGEYAARSGGLVTSYEALQRDTAAELRRIVRFIRGAPPRETALAEAVKAGSFQEMRALEASGEGARLYGNALTPADYADFDSYKTRRGVVGDWRAHFGPDETARAGEILERHAYFRRMEAFTG
jgi:hypothetical protein